MRVLTTGIDTQVGHLLARQAVARQHALNRFHDHALGVRAFKDLLLGAGLDAARIAGVPVVVFLALVSGQLDLVRIDHDLEGHVSIAQAITWLGNVGHRSVMIEAGGKLAASAIKAGLVDKIEWFRAPVLLGGDGRPAIAALGLENLEAPPTFTRKEVRDCGPDIWESWERS